MVPWCRLGVPASHQGLDHAAVASQNAEANHIRRNSRLTLVYRPERDDVVARSRNLARLSDCWEYMTDEVAILTHILIAKYGQVAPQVAADSLRASMQAGDQKAARLWIAVVEGMATVMAGSDPGLARTQ